jgi:nucleoside-diphosphate-sugar epimerase
MKNILITGGTGFIGSSLTKRLIKGGYKVSVFDNDSRGKVNRLEEVKNDFQFVKGDIRDNDAVVKACKNKDIVFHLAYINGTEFFYSKSELVLEVGVKGMINVLDGCIKYEVPEIFLASSSEVYNQPSIIPTPENIPMIIPDPLNPRFSYGGGKIISELMVINYGRKYFKRAVIFRPHNVYGPDMGNEHVIPQFSLYMIELKKKYGSSFTFPIQGTGKETRAFIYIDDFTNGLDLLLRKGKHLEIYNIGTQNETTIEALANKIGKIMHCTITIKPGVVLPGSTTRRLADITKIFSLGFKPTISLEKGLETTVNWYINLDKNNKLLYNY